MGVYVATGAVGLLSLISEDYHCARYVSPLLHNLHIITLRITTAPVCHVCLAHLYLSILLSKWPCLSVTLTPWLSAAKRLLIQWPHLPVELHGATLFTP